MSATICSRCRPSAAPRHIKQLLSYSARAQRRHQSQAAAENASHQHTPRVIFSGIQPTGVPHLGNYLGALRQWKRLQDAARPGDRLFFSVVDLHAITMPQDATTLRQRSREMLAALLAVGLDPEKSTLFYQSSVPAHSELMWILSCTASFGYLGRMTQWKSKLHLEENKPDLLDSAAVGSRLKLGLFSYPVLQAADILVHRATHVPVGYDQKQHLEFARECATNFNHTYGGTLVAPETITTAYPRVMSLQKPTSKMSKSDPNARSRIMITADKEEIQDNIRRAVTDSQNVVTYEPEERPGVANLLELYSQCDPQQRSPQDLVRNLQGLTLGDLKAQVTEAMSIELEGVRERYQDALGRNDGGWLDEIQEEGAERARANANETMRMVREKVGLAPL